MPKSRPPYRTEELSVGLPKAWFDYLTQKAEELGATKSDLVREALQEVYGLEYPDSNKEAAA